MTSSLRTRLLVGTIGGMVLLLTCFSFIVYTVIRRALIREFDSSLTSTAKMLVAFVEIEGDRVEVDSEVEQMPEFRDARHPTYYQIWDLDGEVIARSPLLGTHDLPRFHGPPGGRVHRAPRDPRDNRPQRAIALTLSPRTEEEDPNTYPQALDERVFAMVVARDASTLYGQLGFLKWLLLVAASATVGLALLVAVMVVRRGLSPLQAIAVEIAAISEEDLAARIGDTAVPLEIIPIRDRLNGLLSRLEKAFNRERRLTADVAHELRTPLAGMRTTMEVALAKERDGTEYRAVLSDCREIVLGLQALVTNLLALARLEASGSAARVERVSLAELTNSIWRQCSEQGTSRRITFENRIAEDLVVDLDCPSVTIMLSNLFSNAVEYAEAGGRIWTAAQRVDNVVEIAVTNTGCVLTSQDSAHVFDRFWRVSASRSEIGVHCGLGLTLVREMAKALRGSASVDVQDGLFTARLILPVTTASDESVC